MISLFIYTIAAFGLAYIVGHSRLSLPFRTLLDPGNDIKTFWHSVRAFVLMLVECPACLSFYIGWVYWLAFRPPWGPWWMVALYSSGSSLLLAKFAGLLEEGNTNA